MSWTIIHDACVPKGFEVKTIGIIRYSPVPCGRCGKPVSVKEHGSPMTSRQMAVLDAP